MTNLAKRVTTATKHGILDTVPNSNGTVTVVWLWRDCERYVATVTPLLSIYRTLDEALKLSSARSAIARHESFAQSIIDGDKTQAHIAFDFDNIAADSKARAVDMATV